MTTTVEPLADLGPCGWCGDVQWEHKRGKGGCKVLGCPCGKYEPPKDQPAPAADPEPEAFTPAEPAPAETLDDCGHCTLIPSVRGQVRATQVDCPEHGGRAVAAAAAVDPVETVDVVRRRRREPAPLPDGDPLPDPAAQAAHAEQVAAIDAQLTQPGPDPEPELTEAALPPGALARLLTDREQLSAGLSARLRDLDAAQARIAQLEQHVRALTAERNDERTANASLHRQLAEQETHAARQIGARSAEIAQVRAELNRATAARQRLQDQVDAAVHTGLNAAVQVIGRYTAHACLACGARYGKPFTDHGCGALVPVVVTIARADRPEASAEEIMAERDERKAAGLPAFSDGGESA